MNIRHSTTICQKPRALSALLSIAALLFAQAAGAAVLEYVKPNKLYLDNRPGPESSLHPPRSSSLTTALCVDYGSRCTISYGGEVYDAANQRWRYQFTRTYWLKYYGQPEYQVTQNTTDSIFTICPSDGGWTLNPLKPLCYREVTKETDCDECKTNAPAIAKPPKVGNPIFPSNFMKQEIKVDYGNASGSLRFVRTYRSDLNKWAHNYEMSVSAMNDPAYGEGPTGACFLEANPYINRPTSVRHCYPYAANGTVRDTALRRGNSRVRYFSSGQNYGVAVDIKDRLSPITDSSGVRTGWQVKNGQTLATETYDASGKLIASKELNGQETTFNYSDNTTQPEIAPRGGLLIRVTDAFGAALQFSYDLDGRISTMVAPAGERYIYAYDTKGNLASVTYPDGKQIGYLYNETGKAAPAAESLLTGIVDENNSRFATFTYKDYKALTTEHAGGVNKYTLREPAWYFASVTDPLGTVRDYKFKFTLDGIKRFTGITEPSPSGVGTTSSIIDYDVNGNVSSVTEFNGKKTGRFQIPSATLG